MLSPIMLILIGNSRRQPEVLGLLMSHTMVIILLSVLHLCGSEYGSTDEIFFVTLEMHLQALKPWVNKDQYYLVCSSFLHHGYA
jgi:hypothetical protein